MSVRSTSMLMLSVLVVFLFDVVNAASVYQPVLGMNCNFDSDCSPITNSYCREDACECRATFVAGINKNRCLRTVKVPGDACEEDVQCVLPGGASSCRANTCLLCGASSYTGYTKCDDPFGCAYHEVNNRCWKSREVGEKCSSAEECWIYPGSQMTRKCDAVCVCAKNLLYSATPNPGVDRCVPRNAGHSSKIAHSEWRILLATIFTFTAATKIMF